MNLFVAGIFVCL